MIDEHTLLVLEYPRVLTAAAGYAASPPGVEWVNGLRPTFEAEGAERRLGLTDEIRRLMASPDGFPAPAFPEVRPALRQLEAAGFVLDPADIRGLAALAATARRIRERLKPPAGEFPVSSRLAARLTPAPAFEQAVEKTFGPHDEILDSASPELKRVRRSLRDQRERILSRLESLSGQGEGTERTITLRGERYVMGIRSSEKSRLGGIVHDRSTSGNTLFVEPVGLVEENNRLAELLQEERLEVRRILAGLSDQARGLLDPLRVNLEALVEFDGHRALARLADAQRASLPRLNGRGGRLTLRSFRHPLLPGGRTVVPLDLELTAERRVLLITGPNMGGKTVALKGVGLACAMAWSGFHLPAGPGTEIPLLDGIVADIGDEQSIENDLSTFASHLRRWIEATRDAGPGSLALLDEIGAGTDPAEGAALAQAVLERLAEAGGKVIATTHLGDLKRFASQTEGVVNGSMRFDPDSQRPLYVLDEGLPGQSRALEMAGRLGMPDSLLDRARVLVGTEERQVQFLLRDLEEARLALQGRIAAARREREAAAAARLEFETKSKRLADDYAALKLRGIREGERILNRAREVLQEMESRAADMRKAGRDAASKTQLAGARRTIEEVREEAALASPRAPESGRAVRPSDIAPGERLWAAPLQTWVTVLDRPSAAGKIRVDRDGVRVELPVSALRAGIDASAEKAPVRSGFSYEAPEGTPAEVDLRGLTAEEALARLDAYLDDALLGGLPEVRIIHGKGTGALRQAVRKWLSERADVVSHRLGETWEGGTGVTVARLE